MRNNQKVKRRVFLDTNVLIGCFRNVKADVLAMQRLNKLQDSELFTSVWLYHRPFLLYKANAEI